jgi:hypothetical protein
VRGREGRGGAVAALQGCLRRAVFQLTCRMHSSSPRQRLRRACSRPAGRVWPWPCTSREACPRPPPLVQWASGKHATLRQLLHL